MRHPIALQELRCAEGSGASVNVTGAEIEQAYRASLEKYQADKLNQFGDGFAELANNKLKDIEGAYAVLRQSESKTAIERSHQF